MGAGEQDSPGKCPWNLDQARQRKAEDVFKPHLDEGEEKLEIYVETSVFHAFLHLLMHPGVIEYLLCTSYFSVYWDQKWTM